MPLAAFTKRRPSVRPADLCPGDILTDERGIAAAEFSIIAPLIVGLYLGLAELSFVMGADRQVSHSASVAGDMVAQVEEVDVADMGDIMAAALQVSQIDDNSQYVIEITSYEMDSSGTITNLGSAIYNSQNKALLNTVDPTDFGSELLSDSSGVVVANVAYTYEALGFKRNVKGENKSFLSPTVTLRETFMLKPRRSESVEIGNGEDSVMNCSGSGSTTSCTQAANSNSEEDDD